jgi:hypothetical protein
VWIFFIFSLSKIHVSSTGVVSSLSPLRCCLSTVRHLHAAASCHASFPLNQDELVASTSSSDNALSLRLFSRVETEAFNSHHHSRPPSLDRPTPILHCYKKIISTLNTLPITQSCLCFASFLARVSCHQSSTCCHCFLSLLSHVYRPSTQWHPRWWTSRPSFAS